MNLDVNLDVKHAQIHQDLRGWVILRGLRPRKIIQNSQDAARSA
jgi:hypothetical protein